MATNRSELAQDAIMVRVDTQPTTTSMCKACRAAQYALDRASRRAPHRVLTIVRLSASGHFCG